MPERATVSSRSEKSAEVVVVGGEARRLNGGEDTPRSERILDVLHLSKKAPELTE